MKKICFMLVVTLIAALFAVSSGGTAAATHNLQESTAALPESYTSDHISPIKDQGSHGNCWIFSAMATLESNLKAMGYLNPHDDDGFFDLSEQAVSLDLAIQCHECGGKCRYNHDALSFFCDNCGAQCYGFNRTVNDPYLEGGFEEFVFGYLCSGRGALLESQAPYSGTLDAAAPENFHSLTSAFRVTDVISVVPTAENLKRGIISYGAMTLHCTMESQKTAITKNSDGKYSYAVASTLMLPDEAGHAMSVVGYDDNFSKTNFDIDREALTAQLEQLQTNQPPKLEHYLDLWGVDSLSALKGMSDEDFDGLFLPKNNGAWLIKNSWGEGVFPYKDEGSFDFNGLVWVSYEDASLYNLMPDSRAYAVTGIIKDDTSAIYQLDESGALLHLPPIDEISDSYAVANVFDFTENSKLNYITFEVADGKGCGYELYLCAVKENGKPDTDYSRMRMIHSGTVAHDGYVTIKFTDEIILPQGTAAIVLKLTSGNTPIKIGLDTAYFDRMGYGNEVFVHYFPAISNKSFIISQEKLYSPTEAFGRPADFSLKAAVTPSGEEPNMAFGYADYSQAQQLLVTLTVFGMDKNMYTKRSWRRYQDALTKLQALHAAKNLPYSEQQNVDDAVAELSNAIDDLENKHTWETVLAALALTASLVTIALMLTLFVPSIRKKQSKE